MRFGDGVRIILKRVALGLSWSLNSRKSCIWQDDLVVKSKDSGSRISRFILWFSHLLAIDFGQIL